MIYGFNSSEVCIRKDGKKNLAGGYVRSRGMTLHIWQGGRSGGVGNNCLGQRRI